MFFEFCVGRPEEHVDLNKRLSNIPPVPPDCQSATDLDFSVHAFEHLEVRLLTGFTFHAGLPLAQGYR